MLILSVLKALWLWFRLPLTNPLLVHYRKAKLSLTHAFLLLTNAFNLYFEKTSSSSHRSFKSLLKDYNLYQLSHIRTLLYSLSLLLNIEFSLAKDPLLLQMSFKPTASHAFYIPVNINSYSSSSSSSSSRSCTSIWYQKFLRIVNFRWIVTSN